MACAFVCATWLRAQSQDRPNVNVPGDAAAASAPVVGAYYYPWYGIKPRTVDNDWRNVFRRRLVPPQDPSLGIYRSDDPEVIADHLQQSRRAGLKFWAVSWWGLGSSTDRTFLHTILPHPDAGDFRFALLYESTGRLGDLDRPHYDNWTEDLAYFAETYFKHPNYLRIDGRPVLFVYLTRVYFRDRGAEALSRGREKFPNIYIVGDDVFGPDYRAEWARQFDAVTIYDVYGQSTALHRATTKAVETLAENYAAARQTANLAGAAFIPTVAPGYNDTAVRPGHPGTPRRLVDKPNSQEGDLFRAMICDAGLPNLDDRAGRLMMVTSFNEWYEDTQIEATAGTAGSTTVDDSANGRMLAAGERYDDYGPLYLDILRELTSDPENSP